MKMCKSLEIHLKERSPDNKTKREGRKEAPCDNRRILIMNKTKLREGSWTWRCNAFEKNELCVREYLINEIRTARNDKKKIETCFGQIIACFLLSVASLSHQTQEA